MRNLNYMINEACMKSKAMRRTSWGLDYEDAVALRKQQDEVYKKWLFLKKYEKSNGKS